MPELVTATCGHTPTAEFRHEEMDNSRHCVKNSTLIATQYITNGL